MKSHSTRDLSLLIQCSSGPVSLNLVSDNNQFGRLTFISLACLATARCVCVLYQAMATFGTFVTKRLSSIKRMTNVERDSESSQTRGRVRVTCGRVRITCGRVRVTCWAHGAHSDTGRSCWTTGCTKKMKLGTDGSQYILHMSILTKKNSNNPALL